MLEIEYYGGNSVRLSTKDAKLWIDAKREVYGGRTPKSIDGTLLATEPRFQLDTGKNLVLGGPGEYEVGPFWIIGIPATRHIDEVSAGRKSTIYRVVVEGIRIGVIGNIAAELDDDQLEKLGVIDILLLPVGGNGYTLDATSAVHVIAQVDPLAVVPLHYADSSLSYEVPQDNLAMFTAAYNTPVEQLPKLKLKSPSSLPQAKTVYHLDLLT